MLCLPALRAAVMPKWQPLYSMGQGNRVRSPWVSSLILCSGQGAQWISLDLHPLLSRCIIWKTHLGFPAKERDFYMAAEPASISVPLLVLFFPFPTPHPVLPPPYFSPTFKRPDISWQQNVPLGDLNIHHLALWLYVNRAGFRTGGVPVLLAWKCIIAIFVTLGLEAIWLGSESLQTSLLLQLTWAALWLVNPLLAL